MLSVLTEKKIRDLKPKEKRYVVGDSDCLYLEIMPSGTKAWQFRQRLKTGETVTTTRKTLGHYPALSLYEARLERDRLKIARERARGHGLTAATFREIAEDWYAKKCAPVVSAKYARAQRSRLEMYVYPTLADKFPEEITAPIVLSLLRAVEAQGFKDVPHDVCQLIGQILRFGIATGRAERDVTQDLRGALTPSRQTHYASLKNPREVGELMRALYALPDGSAKRLLLFNAYTFVRPSEARLAAWSEFDLENAEWRIPSERMKMRRVHIVPLSRQALEIVKSAAAFQNVTPWAFPAPRKLSAPMSNMTALATLRRLGYDGRTMTVHGFRSIASTALYEHGWTGAAIERQLAHVDGNQVRAAYNYAEYLPERREMMQWYADHLDALRESCKI